MRMHFPRPRSIAALIVSVGIGGAASVALVTDASAHANRVSGVATCQSDGTYTVTYTVANDFNLSETVTHVSHVGGGAISGLPASIAASPATPFKTATVVQTGVSGSATVASLSVKGTWSDKVTRTDTGQVTLKGNCTTVTPPPTTTQPGAASFVDASCSAATGSYTVPTTAGVNYFVTVNGGAKTAAAAGTVSEPVGTVIVVSAEAQSGFVLTGTTSWTHTIAGASNCTSPPITPPTSTSVTAVNPTITQGVCTAGTESAAFFTIPSLTGVSYSAGGAVLAVGNHPVAFGSSTTVTAAANSGFTMAAGSTTSWTLTATAAVACTTVPPTAVLGVTFNNPPAAKPPVKAPPTAVLPFTGMPLLPTALLAFGLMLTGALLIGSSKRHRATRVVEGHLTPLR